MKTFTPQVDVLGRLKGHFSIEELSGEKSCYAASPAFVRRNCGPIAVRILDAVPKEYFTKCEALGMLPNIDVRLHRLNQGEYPAVPGWHCDGALRETYFGAPQVDAVQVRDTVLSTVSSDLKGVSNFEYLDASLTMPAPADGWSWSEVHKRIIQLQPATRMSEDGVLYRIGADSLHRVSPARVRGWRLFFRMSMWHRDYLGDGGKLADQQQVYILSDDNGW